jgi:hypothetical protein
VSQLLQIALRKGPLASANGTLAPALITQGIPFDGDSLAIDLASAIDHYHQGLPFTAQGRLACAVGAPDSFGSGAKPLLTGRLCIASGVVDHSIGGVGYTAASAVSTAVV